MEGLPVRRIVYGLTSLIMVSACEDRRKPVSQLATERKSAPSEAKTPEPEPAKEPESPSVTAFEPRGKAAAAEAKPNSLPSWYQPAQAREYRVVTAKTQNKLAPAGPGEEPPAHLVYRKERVLRVVLPADATAEQVKSTLVKIVLDETQADPDVDDVGVFAYDRDEDVQDMFTVGSITWAPKGGVGSVTANIASSDKRDGYVFDVTLSASAGKRATSRPTPHEYELCDAFLKAIEVSTDSMSATGKFESDDVIAKRLAKRLKTTKKALEDACLRVNTFNFQ